VLMLYPALSVHSEKIYSTDKFGGLHTGNNIPFYEFSRMENLTGDDFPHMSVREKRGLFADHSSDTCFYTETPLTACVNTAEGILIITEDAVFLDGREIENVRLLQGVKKRCAVPVGRNVFIVPDGIYLKFTDSGTQVIYCSKTVTAENTSLTLCLSDGTDIFPHYYGSFPESASAGEKLVISSSESMELWSFTGSEWVRTDDLYIRLPLSVEASEFSAGQSLYIEAGSGLFSDGYYTLSGKTENSLILSGSIPTEIENVSVTVRHEIPLMDFAVEHNNRIWGCRFGENNRGEFVNEIYSSKLGDPASWYCFQGISTDSYMASLGCSGEFTGAVSTGNEVLFFKENHIIRVFGSTPSDFQVTAVPARGVEKGAHRTVVNLNERIFYKNAEGIMLYDGTVPVNISSALEKGRYKARAAGGIDGRYYISMTDPDGERGLFVFDTVTGLWHREDDSLCTEFIFPKDGILIFAGENDTGVSFFVTSYEKNKDRTERLLGKDVCTLIPEEEIHFSAVTGFTQFSGREKEKLRSIYLTLKLGEGSFVEISLETDSGGKERIFFLDKPTENKVRLPVSVPPSLRSRLEIEGQGEFTLYSAEHRIRKTGEVRNID